MILWSVRLSVARRYCSKKTIVLFVSGKVRPNQSNIRLHFRTFVFGVLNEKEKEKKKSDRTITLWVPCAYNYSKPFRIIDTLRARAVGRYALAHDNRTTIRLLPTLPETSPIRQYPLENVRSRCPRRVPVLRDRACTVNSE